MSAPRRRILHVDLDAFFVAVERVYDPSLRGRPVVVGGSAEGRGVVAAASYEARAFGVRSAMSMARAQRLCPDLVRVSGKLDLYQKASRAVFALFTELTPVVEKVSVDEAYLDMSGTKGLHGSAWAAAERLRRAVRERLQLDVTIGLSGNRLVSKVASAFAKPCGQFEVLAGQEARFFAPLPVGALPGVGPVTEEQLHKAGVRRLGQLAAASEPLRRRIFGSGADTVRARAAGGDDTPVRPPELRGDAKSLGREETFADDAGDLGFLRAKLQELLGEAARQLREHGLLARKVSVKLRRADFVDATRDATLPAATDHDGELLEPALALLEGLAPSMLPARLLGVRFSGLSRGFWQASLWAGERARERWLVDALDRIRDRHGGRAVRSGASAGLAGSRPRETRADPRGPDPFALPEPSPDSHPEPLPEQDS
ncbi:MAG TPA: DNA polymerase IV [Planctomycetota bacterium]